MKRSTYCYWLMLAAAFVVGLGGRAGAQTFDVRVANMAESLTAIDVFVNDLSPAIIGDIAYENTSALATKIPVATGTLNVKVAPAGAGIGSAVINQNVTVASAIEYNAIVYRMDGPPKMLVLERPKTRVPGPGKALLRVVNLSTIPTPAAFDFYLDSTGGTAVFSGIGKEAASTYADVKGEPKSLYIVEAGTKKVVATLVVPFTTGGRLTLIITGATASELKAHALSGENVEGYTMPVLQGLKGGTLPSLRVMHAWRQRNLNGKGIQALDVFIDDLVTARIPNLKYRQASPKFGPLTGDTADVRIALMNEGVGSAVYSAEVPLNRDSDYVVILTKSSEGAAAALTLSAPNTVPTSLVDSFVTRVAYVDDFHKNITVKAIFNGGADTLAFPTLPYLTASDWYTMPRGGFVLQAFRPGETTPFWTGEPQHGSFASTYLTFVVMGDDSSFQIDALNELLPVMQEFDASASVPAAAIAGDAAFGLHNTPNPSAAGTTIRFDMPHAARVTLALFDPLGRKLATLLDESRQGGQQSVDVNTAGLPAGTYIYRLRTDRGEQAVGRMVVVR